MNSPTPDTALQIRATIALGTVIFLRMFGLFLLVPVLSLYAVHYTGATHWLVGVALGIYGLTQGLLQIPLGMLSDRIGRKPVIIGGLCLFIAGCLIAALSDHIAGIILGRALQGAGAIAAAVMALVADVTAEEFRTRAMAVIGISVGIAFMLAMVLAPVLAAGYGLNGVFYIGAGLAAAAMVLLLFVPTPAHERFHSSVEVSTRQLGRIIRDRELLRYNLGVMFLHILLMATFVALPLVLRDFTHLSNAQHWQLYLPVLVASVVLMTPFVMLADRKRAGIRFYPAAVVLILVAETGFAAGFADIRAITVFLLVFFTGFNYLEASLPSTVSKVITPDRKGTALGVFSTCQFLGAFLGGVGGGLCLEYSGYTGVFIFNLVVVVVWLGSLAAINLSEPAMDESATGELENAVSKSRSD